MRIWFCVRECRGTNWEPGNATVTIGEVSAIIGMTAAGQPPNAVVVKMQIERIQQQSYQSQLKAMYWTDAWQVFR